MQTHTSIISIILLMFFILEVAISDVSAQLGLKATALAWLLAASAFKIFRPGQSRQ